MKDLSLLYEKLVATVKEMEVALAFIVGQNRTKSNHFMPAEFAEPEYGLIAPLISGNDM